MVKINEVANFYLIKESMTHKKLQKLCYYSQAWYLANYGEPMVMDSFEAWIHGPVCPSLYYQYREWGWMKIPQKKVILLISDMIVLDLLEKVYSVYGSYTGDELEKLTHGDLPWIKARGDCSPTEYSRNVINIEDMKVFYGEKIGKTWTEQMC